MNVRIDGRLIKWNDDRGFGFIQADSGGPEVFVHISAFQKTGGRPRLGERVSFEIAMGDDGKKRAVAVVPVERPPPRWARVGAREKTSVPGMLASAALVLAIGVGIYRFVETRFPGAREVEVRGGFGEPTVVTESEDGQFRCDRRVHCSQMHSCAEARFFNRHCPGTKMDGDGDGEPYERGPC